MPSAKDLSERVDYLENGLEEFKKRYSEKKMVGLLSKALQTEKRHQILLDLKMAVIVGFTVLSLLMIFLIVLYFFFTEPI